MDSNGKVCSGSHLVKLIGFERFSQGILADTMISIIL